MIGLTLDAQPVEDAIAATRRAISLSMELEAEELYGAVRDETPKKTGETANTWDKRQVGELEYEVFSDDPVTRYLEEGTGVYAGRSPIKPVKAKALKFYWDKVGAMTVWRGDLETKQERFLFARWAESVGMVPIFAWPKGIQGQPYVERAQQRAEALAQSCMDRAMTMTGAS